MKKLTVDSLVETLLAGPKAGSEGGQLVSADIVFEDVGYSVEATGFGRGDAPTVEEVMGDQKRIHKRFQMIAAKLEVKVSELQVEYSDESGGEWYCHLIGKVTGGLSQLADLHQNGRDSNWNVYDDQGNTPNDPDFSPELGLF